MDITTPIDTPLSLASALTELFPSFEVEIADEEIISYHQLILRLTPVIADYLQSCSERTAKSFCMIVNVMVEAGGEQENANSTSLLEHASQVKVRNFIRPYLSATAKRELR